MTIDVGTQCRFASGMAIGAWGSAYDLNVRVSCSGADLMTPWSMEQHLCQGVACAGYPAGGAMPIDGCYGASRIELEAGGHCGGAAIYDVSTGLSQLLLECEPPLSAYTPYVYRANRKCANYGHPDNTNGLGVCPDQQWTRLWRSGLTLRECM